MPSTTSYSFGDIVLLSFPFTNQLGRKKRPAVVISSGAYNQRRPDVILMAVTSKVRQPAGFGDVVIDQWQAAGLIKPSAAKPVVFTAEKRLILKRLGQLKENDQQAVRRVIEEIIG
jgi:mRNA interferase MazF